MATMMEKRNVGNVGSIDAFASQVAEDLFDYLPEEYSEADILVQKVTKQNDVILTGIIIKKKGEDISPTIYVNDFYDCFIEGKIAYKEVLERISNTAISCGNGFNPNAVMKKLREALKDKDLILRNIKLRLLKKDENEAFLKDKPHGDFLDMAYCYILNVGDLGLSLDGNGVIAITNQLLESIGLKNDERLYEKAVKNLNDDFKLLSLDGIVEQAGFDLKGQSSNGFIISNRRQYYGASALMSSKVREMLRWNQTDCIIIPSSVHELMILPCTTRESKDAEIAYLNSLVKEINASDALKPEDVLENHCYFYDAREDEIIPCA